jgi:NADH-quinone oxidoreductase subunit A
MTSMSATSILTPPIAFVIVLMAIVGFSAALRRLAYREKALAEGAGKPYACGEDVATPMVQSDYSQFFPFALFFTILHVVALMVITMPMVTPSTFLVAVLYLFGGVLALSILYRR